MPPREIHFLSLMARTVRESYAEALRFSFVTAIVASGLLVLLMLPIRLPKLNQKAPGGGGD